MLLNLIFLSYLKCVKSILYSFVPLPRNPLNQPQYNMAEVRPGATIGEWTIVRTLGQGAFGVVLLGVNRLQSQCAIKLEKAADVNQLLKMEVDVLESLARTHHNRHFVQMFGLGRYESYNYLAMTLVGKSFEDILKV